MNHQRQRGISLLVVLSMMLAATLAATALYVLLNRYQARSGANLYTESALAAAKAGESATKAWFTYEGEQVRATLQDYLNQTTKKAFKLSIGADYQKTANARGQSFDAYLLDVLADSTQPNAPVSVKVQINAVGQDGAQAVTTVVYDIKGLKFQKAPPVYVTPSATTLIPDALHLGGGLHIKSPLTIQGSAYVENFFWQYSGVEISVTGSLVFGINSTSWFNDKVTISDNLYVAGTFTDGSGADVTVEGDAVFTKPITNMNGSYLFKGDLYCADSVGRLNEFGALTSGIHKDITVKGNATFQSGYVAYGSSTVHFEKDVGFNADTQTVMSLGIFQVDGNAAIKDTACFKGTTTFQGSFLRTLSKGSSTPACIDPTVSVDTDWDGWQAATSDWAVPFAVTAATSLPEIDSTLTNNGAKDNPFTMSLTQLEHLADSLGTTWDDLFGYSVAPQDWRGTCDAGDGVNTQAYYTHRSLNCLATNMPVNKRYNGFVLLDLRGKFNGFASDIEPLSDKFILIMDAPPLPQTSADGRVLVYYVNNLNSPIGVAGDGTFNGIIYSEQKLFLGGGTINGSLLSTYHDNNITQTGDGSQITSKSLSINYSSSVITDLFNSGLMLDKNGNSYVGNGYKFESVYTLSLLSPRLQVETVNTVYGPTSFDPGTALNHGYSLAVTPALITVDAKQYANWGAVTAQHPVTYGFLPNGTGCTTPSVANSSLDLDNPGTYNVIYTSTCTNGGISQSLVAHQLVWVRPTSTTMTIPVSSANISSSGALSSSSLSSSSVVVSSSSSAIEQGTLSYQFLSCPTKSLFPYMTWGVQIGNGTHSALSLNQFRVRYFINENSKTAKTAYTVTAPAQLIGSAPTPTVSIENVSPNTTTGAYKGYNLLATAQWPPSDASIPSNGFAGFENLKLTRKDGKFTYWIDDYSYDGCYTSFATNDWVVFERKDANNTWSVVSGTLPDFEPGHRLYSFDSGLEYWTSGGSAATLTRSTTQSRHGSALRVDANSTYGNDTAKVRFSYSAKSYDSLIVWVYTGSDVSLTLFNRFNPSPAWRVFSDQSFSAGKDTWNRLAYPLSAFITNGCGFEYVGDMTIGIVFPSSGTYYIDDIMLK